MPNLRNCDKGGLSSLVNNRGQLDKPLGKQVNWYKTPFQQNRRNLRSSRLIGTE